jgi:hypothetical protein
VKVGSGGATGAMSGYQVFTSDGVRATNADAMDVGCSIYQ